MDVDSHGNHHGLGAGQLAELGGGSKLGSKPEDVTRVEHKRGKLAKAQPAQDAYLGAPRLTGRGALEGVAVECIADNTPLTRGKGCCSLAAV